MCMYTRVTMLRQSELIKDSTGVSSKQVVVMNSRKFSKYGGSPDLIVETADVMWLPAANYIDDSAGGAVVR